MSKRKNLPNGMPIDAISRAYIREIERHSPQLIEEIKSFLATDIPEDVKEATVEVFPDEYGDGYASIGLYFAGTTTKSIRFAEYVNDLPSIAIESYEEESIPDEASGSCKAVVCRMLVEGLWLGLSITC